MTQDTTTSKAAPALKRVRRGGGAARRAAQQTGAPTSVPRITRAIPDYEPLSARLLDRIEENAETVLWDIGVEFSDNPGALDRWRAAGAEVRGTRVHIPRGLAKSLCATAPSRFTQIARNPDRSVEIGGRDLVLAPVYGPPFVRGREGGRRYATMEDFQTFVRLGHMSPWLHHSGGTVCEPTDVPVPERHLDMLMAHMILTDKPFMGGVTAPENAADCVEMADILFGGLKDRTALLSLININSPLTFDATMMGALEVYAAANQATIISPFIVGGAMAPVSVMGTLTQVYAEVMAGVAYAQLIRPGAPVIFGAFVTSIDMGSGAPTFGTPEAAQITYGAGQLARRLGLPYRSAGGFTGSKLVDTQAGLETANSLNAGLLAGVNFMLHACGWLEGGLVASFEKFVIDADQLGALHKMAAGIPDGEDDEAMDAIQEVGPGGHYLGCAHTQANFKTAFWRSELLDYQAFETWEEQGARDTKALAAAKMDKMLAAYSAPPLDPQIQSDLEAFVARRRAELSG